MQIADCGFKIRDKLDISICNPQLILRQHSSFKHITDKSIYSTNGPDVKRLCQAQTFINGNTGSSGKI
jgi:hypothetical protein